MYQALLDFEINSDNSRDNFIVSPSNEQAFHAVSLWPKWKYPCIVIYGPKGCGKTHMAHIWRKMSGAVFVDPVNNDVASICGNHTNFIVEHLGDICEEKLFHLYNHVVNNGGHMLLTSVISPHNINFTLPDLASRLRASECCSITEPDDSLLSTLIVKQFSDRQLRISKNVLEYLLPRIDRSFYAVSNLVEKLDKHSLAESRNITIPFVREVLNIADK